MADLEDVTLDGRPLQSLRVADLKAALEERGLSKSGQKNALIKRLKGALMLENLQKTSTAHVGLQPNSQIGEEMSQNSFIKQYLAKQQELLRQRLEREAREAYDTNDQEDHTDVNNSICPPQVPDASTAVTDHFKPPGPSSGQAVPAGLSHRHQEAAVSRPPASASLAQGRNEAAADSDEEESEDGEDDGDDDDDWDSNIQRRLPRQPVRAPMARERSAASCQPQQQHIPSVLSPQLRQPTPPPSPPPELSFPLPDTPKQSPPSPDVAAGRSPSSSSSGSSSSGSRSSSPEPHSGHAERKPGPLTLLARKMESEGAFSGTEWHCRDANRQDNCSSSTFPNKVRPEGLVSSVPHMLSASHAPINLGANQGHTQVPVLKSTAERDAELEREKSLELQRQAQKKKHEQEQALEEERVRAALEREQQKAFEKEQFEREQALERERLERELALARETEEKEQALALERQRALERELAAQREYEERRQKEEQEKAKELERVRILERERALEQERVERERILEAERVEKERMERERALELERLEKERLEKEAALEREKLEREKEQMEREKALEKERIERERIEQLRALERERIEKEKALEQERIERERLLEQERLEKEKAVEQERLEREKALEQERIKRERAIEQERIEKEKALEQERIKREKALEQERVERERALEQERINREQSLEQERIKREKALEQERIKQEKLEREQALEKERIEREKFEKEKALERERIERERTEKERIEREKIERERALELERRERERALELQRLEYEKQENERLERERALEQERIEKEKAKEQKQKAERDAFLERERLEKAKQERVQLEKAQELKRQALEEERMAKEKALELEKERIAEQDSVEKKQATQKVNTAHERANESRMADVKSEEHLTPSRGCEIGFVPLPTPPPLSTGTSRKASTEADKQEGEVHGPVTCEGQAEESNTPKSPQHVFKKFRFTRETPLQQQTASRVIKRPRTFSDTPQPCSSVMTASNTDGQQQKELSADRNNGAGNLDVNPVEAVERAKKDVRNVMPEDREELDTNEAAVEESILTAVPEKVMCPSSTVGASGRDTNVNKMEKKDFKRTASNDSSSSESDSASSSSPDSSPSSREKTYTSRLRKDEENASPQRIEVGRVQKTKSPAKVETSSANTQIDEGLHTKQNEASLRDDVQARKGSDDDKEKPGNSCVGESAVSELEKGTEANNETPKAFSTRKISLSSSKSSPGSSENDHELGTASGRKRRWGSSTAVTAKKTTISITTDSLKSLIPDIRPALNQEAVMELHPDEPVLSENEEEEKDHGDQELQIRRTVTQIVHVENQEEGQKDAKRRREESEDEDMVDEKDMKTSEDPTYTRAIESASPLHTCHDTDVNTVIQSDILIRRSISQQKTSVSITIDDPVRTSRQPSPPRGNVSNIVHVCNLVRPFTLGQLKELLSRTGTLVEDGFWIDKIKSHCYVTYSSSEEAVSTREALHGVKWPQSNPKVLSVDFCQQDELEFHKNLGSSDRPGIGSQSYGRNLPSLLPERDQWVEREREMERRERARADREWDRDKVREFGKASEQKEAGAQRSRSRDKRCKEREKSNEKKSEKKEKPEDPPAKLLDDLFRKTKAVPCIYWLPLTEEQYLQREAARVERRKEREMLRKKEAEEAELKKKEENKERLNLGSGIPVDRSESEKIKERDRARDRGRDRDREREREVDKRRDGHRRPGVGTAPSGRRSRSRSDPRERRR